MRLEGKVVVITGVGSGIGRAMATLFATEGARIIANDFNAETLTEVVETVGKAGNQIVGIAGDIADQALAERIVETATSTYGQLDVLCNNAGIGDLNHGIADVTNELWQRILDINLNGPMFTIRRAVPIMIKQGGGSIINTASSAGLGGGAMGVAYTASKHGLVGLTRSTAWMYAQKGIRCNAICPGGVKTNIMTNIMTEFDADKMDPVGSERTRLYVSIMPGLMEPIDIAHLALFLASDESRYINGAIIPADAGWRAA